MKRLLSAVTSAVMGLSLMTGAFASSVSAAGGYTTVQPNVSMGEVAGVTANKTADADVVFDFGSYTAKAGDSITVPVKIDAGTNPVAAMDVVFSIDSPLEITKFGGKSPACGNASVMPNVAEKAASFTSLDGSDPIVPTKDGIVFNVVVQVPADCADGVYHIGFGDKCQVFKDGSNFNYSTSVLNGDITVGEPDPGVKTTTSTKPNTTTTKKPDTNVDADVVFDFGSYAAKAGDSITIPVKVDAHNNPVAAMDVVFSLDSPLEITKFGGKSPACGNASVMPNVAEKAASFTSLDGSDPIVPTKDGIVFNVVVQIPADCADGVYYIGFADKCQVFKDGSNFNYSTAALNGDITVGIGGTTTSTTKPITTTTKKPDTNVDADVVFDFGNYTAKAGDSITIPVTIDAGTNPVAAMDVVFAIDSPLEITKFGGKSPACGNASVMPNVAEKAASFTSLDGSDPIVPSKGGIVFNVVVQIPADCADGVYHIGFADKCQVFKDGSNFNYSTAALNGDITVGNVITTTAMPTTTKPVTTTTKPVNPEGQIDFDFGSYVAKPGEDVTVAVKIDAHGNAVAAIDAVFDLDSPLEITKFGGKSPACGNATVTPNVGENAANFTSLDGSDPIVPTENGIVFNIVVHIPEDCADGDYHIAFDKCEVFMDSSNTYEFSAINGNITVSKDAITTTVPVTTTKTTTTIAPAKGTVEWVIPTKTAKPGDTVTMDVLVKNSDLAVAGAQFEIDAKAPIEYKSAKGSDAYASTLVANDDTQEFAFGEGVGNGITAKNDDVVLTLTYTVPYGTTNGTYPVTWDNAFITDTNGLDITDKVTLTDGAIIVKAPFAGEIEWILDTVKAKPGDTVKLNAVVSDDSKTPAFAVAGAQFDINAKAPVEYVSIAGSEAYGATIVNNDDLKEFAFANATGAGTAAADGAVVLTLTYKVPENCAAGTYPVEWSNAFICDTDGNDLSANVTLTNGAIIIEDTEITGDATWTIPEKTAKPGDTVEMDVLVTYGSDDKIPVAGAQFSINAATPIGYVSATGSDAYGDTLVANDATKEFAFADAEGKGTAAGEKTVVLKLTYTVPEDCAAGRYPVEWSNAFISDEFGREITDKITLVDGAIIVEVDTTTSTTTTTTGTIDINNNTGSRTTTTSTGTTTTTTIQAGAIKWVIDTVHAKPGETVTVNMVVDDPNAVALEIGGAQFVIKGTDPINYVSAAGSDAYGDDLVANDTLNEYAFANATGAQTAGADGAKVIVLTYKVPEDCAAGEYPVTISGLFVSDENGNDITNNVVTVDGAIIVDVETTTTTTGTVTTTTATDTTTTATDTTTTVTDTTTTVTDTTTSTDTTTTTTVTTTTVTTTTGTTTTLQAGAIMWVIDTVHAKPGETVTVNMVVSDPNKVALALGGAQFVIKGTDPINYVSAAGSAAYGDDIVANDALNEYAFANATGAQTAAANGATVIALTYTVPEDCAAGEYPVTITDLFACDKNGNDMTKNIITVNGAIIVDVETTTTTTTTTTATDTTTTVTDTTTTVTDTTTTATDTTTTVTDTTTTVTDTTTTVTDTTTTVTDTTTSTDTTTTTTTATTTGTTTTLQAGAIMWVIDTVHAKPGETVTVNMVVSDPNKVALALGGAQFVIKGTDPINYVSAAGSAAYGDELVANDALNEYAFANATGVQTAAANGATVIALTYTVPEDCAAGEYPVTITDLFACDENGNDMTKNIITVNGAIIVDVETTTTTTTTTTTATDTTTTVTDTTTTVTDTTTSTDTTTTTTVTTTTVTTTSGTTTTLPKGAVIWSAETVEAMPGDTVKVNVVVKDPNGSGLPIAGAQFNIDSVLDIIGVGKDNNGYGAQVVYNPVTGTYEFAFADGTGTAVPSKDGSIVVELTIKVPDDCAAGEYPVKLGNHQIFDENGNNITDRVLLENGAVIVKVVTTTTTTVTTTDTTTTTTATDTTTTVTDTTTTVTDTTTTVTDTTTTVTDTTTTVTDTTTTVTDTTTTVTDTTTTVTDTTTTVTDTTTTSTDTTTTTTTTMPAGYDHSYATIATKVGYYFSHDDGRTRPDGSEGGFSKNQIVELTIVDVYEDGRTEERTINRSLINFNGETPETKYNSRYHDPEIQPTIEDFTYEVAVYYGDMPLVDADGNAISITAYIGVKGDADLNNLVDARDASAVLTYYTLIGSVGHTPADTQLSTSALVTGADDELDNLAAFLADVDKNEYDPDNWSLTREQRHTPEIGEFVDARDASAILTFYAYKGSQDNPEYSGKTDGELWDMIVPGRFGK